MKARVCGRNGFLNGPGRPACGAWCPGRGTAPAAAGCRRRRRRQAAAAGGLGAAPPERARRRRASTHRALPVAITPINCALARPTPPRGWGVAHGVSRWGGGQSAGLPTTPRRPAPPRPAPPARAHKPSSAAARTAVQWYCYSGRWRARGRAGALHTREAPRAARQGGGRGTGPAGRRPGAGRAARAARGGRRRPRRERGARTNGDTRGHARSSVAGFRGRIGRRRGSPAGAGRPSARPGGTRSLAAGAGAAAGCRRRPRGRRGGWVVMLGAAVQGGQGARGGLAVRGATGRAGRGGELQRIQAG
jgi:hypothetical protein